MSEDIPEMKAFCLRCATGHETSVERSLLRCGLEPVRAMTERIVVRNSVRRREERALMPGYVLFEALELSEAHIASLRQNPYFYKLMFYQSGDYSLKGADLEFVAWLRRKQGIMTVSKVCKVGDRIRVVDGPLMDFEGCIVEVNRKRNCVAIQLSENSVMNRIWCSIEYVEMSDKPDEKL